MHHVHVRIVVTTEIKRRVRDARQREEEEARRRRTSRRPKRSEIGLQLEPGGARNRRLSSPSSAEKPTYFSKSRSPRRRSFGAVDMEEIEMAEKESELNRPSWTQEDEDLTTSLIPDPSRATSLERRWMEAMAVDKDSSVARRFKKFDTSPVSHLLSTKHISLDSRHSSTENIPRTKFCIGRICPNAM